MRSNFWLSRYVFLRALGFLYLVAFVSLADQLLPLIGSEGLLPADDYLGWAHQQTGSRWTAMKLLPTVFHLGISDTLMVVLVWVGAALSLAVVFGLANVPILVILWALYFSFVSVGQRWFQFGWESQLLETGLLAVFLVPLLSPRSLPAGRPPPRVMIVLAGWLIARIMLGAGLIKLRGDPCWAALTCLDFHFETQPVPGPLSRWFHNLPTFLLHGGVAFNFFAELIAPFLLLGPRAVRHLGVACILAFQGVLILSGNLAFLNWLTILPCLLCIDDSLWSRLLPRRLGRRAAERAAAPRRSGRLARVPAWGYAAVVLWLSVPVVTNLLSEDQAMNTSFQSLRIVNTYGAFGSVGADRWEIVVEGTEASTPTAQSLWREYEFKVKPGSLDRRPPWITPYHYRLDWLAWFAGIEAGYGKGVQREGWLVHFVWKLLHADAGTLSLLANDPFPDAPPRWVRVQLYRYRFAASDSGRWWERELVGTHLPPLSADDPRLLDYLRNEGWLD